MHVDEFSGGGLAPSGEQSVLYMKIQIECIHFCQDITTFSKVFAYF